MGYVYECSHCKKQFCTKHGCIVHQRRTRDCCKMGVGAIRVEHAQPNATQVGSDSEEGGGLSRSGSESSSLMQRSSDSEDETLFAGRRCDSKLKISDVFPKAIEQDAISFIVDEGLSTRQSNRFLRIINHSEDSTKTNLNVMKSKDELTLKKMMRSLDTSGEQMGMPRFKNTNLKKESDIQDFPGQLSVLHRDPVELVTEKFKEPRPQKDFTMAATDSGGQKPVFTAKNQFSVLIIHLCCRAILRHSFWKLVAADRSQSEAKTWK